MALENAKRGRQAILRASRGTAADGNEGKDATAQGRAARADMTIGQAEEAFRAADEAAGAKLQEISKADARRGARALAAQLAESLPPEPGLVDCVGSALRGGD